SGLGSADSLAATSRIPGTVVEAADWARDGKRLAIAVLSQSWDIWTCSIDDTTSAKGLLLTTFGERFPQFSPDGRWIAYQSNESGRAEIYVQELSGAGGKWQISVSGGQLPRWRADGKEIFFQGLDQTLMAVDVHTSETFQAGVPSALFRIPLM